MASSALAFVEGLQGGMDHRANSKRKKKIDKLLDYESMKKGSEMQAMTEDVNSARAMEGKDAVDFESFTTGDQAYDGFGSKIKGFFGKLGSAFSGGAQKEQALKMEDPQSAGINGAGRIQGEQYDIHRGNDPYGNTSGYDPMNPSGQQMMAADGGMVRHYANGGGVNLTPQELAQLNRLRDAKVRAAGQLEGPPRQGVRTVVNDTTKPATKPAPRAATPAAKPAQTASRLSRLNPNVTLRGAGKVAGAVAKKLPGIGGAISAADAISDSTEIGYDERMDDRFGGDWGWGGEDKGEASIGGALEFGAKRALGFASDLGDALSFGQASRLYADTREDMSQVGGDRDGLGFGSEDGYYGDAPAAAAITAADLGDAAAEKVQAQPTDPSMETAAPAPAQSAIEADPEPEFQDFAQAPVVDPQSMPTMPTKEWIAYRVASVSSMLMRGYTAEEAHQSITNMQQRGFMNNGMQALTLLANGDPQRAAMALKAAYQYFPNGVDVKFGITKGKDGRPALMAMGTDEDTGEPKGKPVLITPESLAAQINNMEDPSSFTAWTKDWRDEQFKERKYNEVDKPLAEAQGRAMTTNAEANASRADASFLTALNGRGTGGLKNSDVAGASDAFREEMRNQGLDRELEEGEALLLAGLMEQLYQQAGGQIGENVAMQIVLSAMQGDEMSARVLQQYGIGNATSTGE